jgi:hypothetical protein
LFPIYQARHLVKNHLSDSKPGSGLMATIALGSNPRESIIERSDLTKLFASLSGPASIGTLSGLSVNLFMGFSPHPRPVVHKHAKKARRQHLFVYLAYASGDRERSRRYLPRISARARATLLGSGDRYRRCHSRARNISAYVFAFS